MKEISPSEWVVLSKADLGLSDVITIAYVNQHNYTKGLYMSLIDEENIKSMNEFLAELDDTLKNNTPTQMNYSNINPHMPKQPTHNNPVYNNTLSDHQKSGYGSGFKLVLKECECGALKTYGKDCKKSFHSSWCPLK